MKTTTTIDWAAKITEGGKENYYRYSIHSKETAEAFINRYKENIRRDKKVDTNKYEVVKRTVITHYGEWENV